MVRILASALVFLFTLSLAQAAPGNGWTRLDLRFPCGDTRCAGWLYLPDHAEGRMPAIVMGHGFAGTRDSGLEPFAERFARAGIAAFAIDYRNFGASGGTPRQEVDPRLQVADFAAALAFIRRRPEIDAKRVALWGSSMGAGVALIAAANDPKLAALVLQAPQIDTRMEGDATHMSAWFGIRLVLAGWHDMLARALGGKGVTIPAIAPSGQFAMISDDAAYKAFRKLVGPKSAYRNAVIASSAFNFKTYNPASRESDIHIPVLVVASPQDRFAPFAAAQDFVRAVKGARLVTFKGDHFDIYAPPAATRAAAQEAAFLADALKAP